MVAIAPAHPFDLNFISAMRLSHILDADFHLVATLRITEDYLTIRIF